MAGFAQLLRFAGFRQRQHGFDVRFDGFEQEIAETTETDEAEISYGKNILTEGR